MTVHHPAASRQPGPVLSRSVEDYLKAVYHLSRHGGTATTKDVAVRLGLAAPSVSMMLKRLTTLGLVKRAPYQGAQLTREGRHAALKTIRRHRVLELYLTRYLGFDWDTVHAEAERLEHAASDLRVTGAIYLAWKFLDRYPFSPHPFRVCLSPEPVLNRRF